MFNLKDKQSLTVSGPFEDQYESLILRLPQKDQKDMDNLVSKKLTLNLPITWRFWLLKWFVAGGYYPEIPEKIRKMVNKLIKVNNLTKEELEEELQFIQNNLKDIPTKIKHYWDMGKTHSLKIGTDFLDNKKGKRIVDLNMTSGLISEALTIFKKAEDEFQVKFEATDEKSGKPIYITFKKFKKLDILGQYSNNYYWIDLHASSSKEEADALGHCGVGAAEGTLVSLREIKKVGDKLLVLPKLTLDISSDNYIIQCLGKGNKPIIKKYSYYVRDFIKNYRPLIGTELEEDQSLAIVDNTDDFDDLLEREGKFDFVSLFLPVAQKVGLLR